jgi:class 3 adenylate cyclase
MDIGVWLRGLGLERYEAAFRDNEIDETVLPSLTLEDLKDLGVNLAGHRRKLLDAIAALRPDKSPKDAVRDEPPLAGAPTKDSAERRQVTVMFSDLVGSTALSARMDPEDLREVISAYQQCVAEAVRRFGGFIAKYLGDGVLVYFGYPEAHEHDAERAVRAGLDVVAAVAGLQTRAPLQTRVGIATGLVVVGDLIGSGQAQERGIVGETPNLAARLQSIAEPNTVVVAEGTRRLIGNLFDLQDLGPQELKGIAGPIHAFAALRASSAESRFEAFHLTDLTAFVGREEETDILLRRWSRARAGEGQVVLISGEAGIGKSRLTAGLLERLADEQHIRLRYFCSPQDTNSALFPLIRHMERAAGFVHDDSPQAKLDKLGTLLAKTSTSEQDLPLFAELLALPNDGRYPAPALDALQRRQKTLDALLAQIVTLSGEQPVLILFEDTHWIDPTTLELIGRTVDLIRDRRVLLIVTFRPEFEPPWTGRPHVTTVTLNRLVQRDVDDMIDRIVGNKFIPASIRQDIIERTDGIPLFVEELTRAVLEAATESEARQTVAAAPSPLVAVPATLQASLMARLDRLGPAKEIAQMGAAIGREFSHALIAAVARKSEVELEGALDRTIAAGLLFRQGTPPYAAYLFKHALVQDAAYGTLLREPRRALHARIVEALESQFAEVVERQPELLARHCGEAGLIEKAALLWGRAGQRSLERAAVAEAVEQLTRALSQIATLPSTPILRRERIKLQVAVAGALMHVKGYAASETRGALDQARALIEEVEALGEPLEDPLLLFSVLYGLWVASYNTFDGDSVRERAAQFLAAAERQAATVPLMVGRRLMGISLAHTGDLVSGRAHLDDARRLYNAAEHRSLATRFGEDIGIGILFQRALPLWMLGYPEAALADCNQAMSDA